MPKFTELADGTVPIDYGSVMAVSTYDGVSAYTSEQFTMNELQQVFLENDNPNGRVLNFDSSVNTEAITDSNTGFRVELDAYGGGETVISTDGAVGTSDYSEAWIYADSSSLFFGFGVDGGSNGNSISFADGGFGLFVSNAADNISGASVNYTTVAANKYPIAIASNGAVLNGATRTNSVALGGVGLTIDKDDTAFCENLEVQGGTLSHTGTNLGFYGTTPIAQQTGVAVSAAAIHAALVNLGLITA